MAGGVVMVVILLIFPVLVAIGGLVIALILGVTLNADARRRFEGTELGELSS